MTDIQKFLVAGALLNSALYLSGVFVAGLATNNSFAWRMALVSLGMTFLCYALQFLAEASPVYRYAAGTAVAGSIVAGILAGVSLLWIR